MTIAALEVFIKRTTNCILNLIHFMSSPPLTRRSQRNQRDRGRNNESNQVRDILTFLVLQSRRLGLKCEFFFVSVWGGTYQNINETA